jgi:folylpolyglutamate synthase
MPVEYKEAIAALNGLQTNHAILDKIIKERQKNVHLNIPLTKKFLEISGITMQDLEKLKVIHVSGTKGKGWDLSNKSFDIFYYAI